MKKKIVHSVLIILGYILIPASLYAVIFTYYGNAALIGSLILCVSILVFFIKRKFKILSKVLMAIPLLVLTSFNIFNIRNLKPSNTQVERLMIGNMERSFRYYVPSEYSSSPNKAVIIALHGFK